jgi:hypothetical protein
MCAPLRTAVAQPGDDGARARVDVASVAHQRHNCAIGAPTPAARGVPRGRGRARRRVGRQRAAAGGSASEAAARRAAAQGGCSAAHLRMQVAQRRNVHQLVAARFARNAARPQPAGRRSQALQRCCFRVGSALSAGQRSGKQGGERSSSPLAASGAAAARLRAGSRDSSGGASRGCAHGSRPACGKQAQHAAVRAQHAAPALAALPAQRCRPRASAPRAADAARCGNTPQRARAGAGADAATAAAYLLAALAERSSAQPGHPHQALLQLNARQHAAKQPCRQKRAAQCWRLRVKRPRAARLPPSKARHRGSAEACAS